TLLLDKTPSAEKQVIRVLATSGTFDLTLTNPFTLATYTITGLAFNISQAALTTALNDALQNASPKLNLPGATASVVRTALPGGIGFDYEVTFGGAAPPTGLLRTNVPPMVAVGSSLATAAVVFTEVDGNAAPNAFGGNLTVGDSSGAAQTATAR